MRKYVYLFVIIHSFLMFMIGWNHMQDNGLEIFNVGIMMFTPITGFVLGLDWISQMDKKLEKELSIDNN